MSKFTYNPKNTNFTFTLTQIWTPHQRFFVNLQQNAHFNTCIFSYPIHLSFCFRCAVCGAMYSEWNKQDETLCHCDTHQKSLTAYRLQLHGIHGILLPAQSTVLETLRCNVFRFFHDGTCTTWPMTWSSLKYSTGGGAPIVKISCQSDQELQRNKIYTDRIERCTCQIMTS